MAKFGRCNQDETIVKAFSRFKHFAKTRPGFADHQPGTRS
jgi:hypothetical protein